MPTEIETSLPSTKQIEISLPETGKIAISVTTNTSRIEAKVGQLTYRGDFYLNGPNGFGAKILAAIKKELATELHVALKIGTIKCTGSLIIETNSSGN